MSLPGHESGEEAQPRFRPFIAQHGLALVGAGNHRAAYRTRSGRYVVKFPCGYDDAGQFDNEYEARHWRESPLYPRCRLIAVAGASCLVMEWVEPATCWELLPPWVDSIDCGQVGYTRRGELVAFDFA